MSKTHDTLEIFHKTITLIDVTSVCRNISNHKAPGAELISFHLKYGGHALYHLASLYNAIITLVHIPNVRKYNIIIPVYKGKRKPKDNIGFLGPTINKVLKR